MLSGAWPHILHSGVEAFQPALCAVACPLQIARVVLTEISISPLSACSQVRYLLDANFSFKISWIVTAIGKCKNEITTQQGSSLCTSLLAQGSAAVAACCSN